MRQPSSGSGAFLGEAIRPRGPDCRATAKTDKLIDRLFGAGIFDAISGLAEAYPLRVFPDAIGMSPTKPRTLLPYGHGVFNSLGPCNALFQTSMRDVADVMV